MFGNRKKLNAIWLTLTLLAVLSMVAFTALPLIIYQ